MNKDLNFILDLDQTLISAEDLEKYDKKANEKRSKKFRSHDMDGYYIVFERPGLQEFLDFIFSNYNVSVWTAASKDYALFIIDKIIVGNNKNRILDWVFFSYHCDLSSKLKNGTKDLSMLWDVYNIPGYNSNNTVIIDDYDEVYNTQPNNAILAPAFEYTKKKSYQDNFLEELRPKLIDMVNKIKNNEKEKTKEINSHFSNK